jgi:hypothetical protein
LATLIASIAVCVQNHHPALPDPLSLTLTLDAPTREAKQPLVVTGRPSVADFLHVRFLTPETIVFVYDHWGTPALRSAPVRVVPGTPVPLVIEMPGLWNVNGTASGPDRLRVIYGGAVVFDEDVPSHSRSPAALYFARNPHQGPCTEVLAGKLLRADGRSLQGSGYFGVGERLLAWLKVAHWQALAVLFLSACAVLFGSHLRRPAMERWRRLTMSMRQWDRHLVFIVSAALCTLAFALVLAHGSPESTNPHLLRSFYDFQAASLLQGHLDVPKEAVHGEAFLYQDKAYGYFGIVPALLRLPFVFFDVRFGLLTDEFMIAGYFGCLLFAYLVLGFACSMVGGPDGRPRPWATLALLANLGLGSTLFFVSSRGFVYHEAVVSGLCFALGTAYFSLRYLAAPGQGWWKAALLCGTLSVHCRPPLGLFALCLLGATALTVIVRPLFAQTGTRWSMRLPRFWPRHLAVGLLAMLGILSFNGLSYLKFRTFDGAPLRYHEQYRPERLARFEGKSFHLSNIPLNSSAYLLRPGWHLHAHFPYLFTSAHEPGPGSSAKIDLAEPMLGLPFAMPGLFWLALAGLLGALARHRKLRPLVLVLTMGVLPMGLAMFAAVASSQRYTADFLPFLVCAAALGLAMLDGTRPALRALVGTLTVVAIVITLALTLRYQGELLWSIPSSVARDYQDLGQTVDGLLKIPPEREPIR